MWKSRLKDVFFIVCIGVLFWLIITKREGQRIGYIDVKIVFAEFDLKKELQKKYQSQMAGKKQMIDSLSFEVQQLGIELESSPKPEQAKMDVFLAKRKQYMELVKLYDEEDKQVNSEYDNQILTQMNQYVKEFGDENGYDMILGSLGQGNIMQANDKNDLTKTVIKYINKKYAGEK